MTVQPTTPSNPKERSCTCSLEAVSPPSSDNSSSDGAQEVVAEYYERIGGRPVSKTKKKRTIGSVNGGTPESSQTGRKRSRRSDALDTPEMSPPLQYAKPDWYPGDGEDWEKLVASIDTIERDGASGGLFVYLNWKNGKKSRAAIEQCYDKCPRKV